MYTVDNYPKGGYFEFNTNPPGKFDHANIEQVSAADVMSFLEKTTDNASRAFHAIVEKGSRKHGYGGFQIGDVYVVFWHPNNRGFTS